MTARQFPGEDPAKTQRCRACAHARAIHEEDGPRECIVNRCGCTGYLSSTAFDRLEKVRAVGLPVHDRAVRAVARRGDPATSHAAAASVNLNHGQLKVLALLDDGPGTHEDLVNRAVAKGIKLSASGCRTRCSELRDLGLVEATGHERRTASGRRSMVWRKTLLADAEGVA